MVGDRKILMWSVHIVLSLLPFEFGGDGGEKWNLCCKVGKLVTEAITVSS